MNAHYLSLALGAALALAAPAVRANCAMPVGYKATVEGNKVTVCNEDFGKRPCPDADGLIRVDKASGAPVKVLSCGTGTSSTCYVDECVPKGSYQYGYAKPFDCCSSCCGTSYYEEVTVDADPTGCTPNAGTEPFTGSVPWKGKGQIICDYAGGTGGASSSGGAAGAAGKPASSDGGDDGGCAVSSLRSPTGAVLAFNALVAAVGLVLMARRRRTRS